MILKKNTLWKDGLVAQGRFKNNLMSPKQTSHMGDPQARKLEDPAKQTNSQPGKVELTV